MNGESGTNTMSETTDPLHFLLGAEQEARSLIEQAEARAKAIREEAERQQREGLARAGQEARTAAEQARRKILDETEPVCRAKVLDAGRQAAKMKDLAKPRLGPAVEHAVHWLLLEGPTHDRRGTVR